MKIKEKLKKVIDRGYITPCDRVQSLTHFFSVPKTYLEVNGKKVVDDIRMVYDSTRSGLNEAVWTPWFPMPTATSLFRSVEAGTFMGDCDIGEIF